MRQWPVQDAKARFSELLETCLSEGPQMVSRRGENKAVLVPLEEWKRLNEQPRPSVKEVLLSERGRFDMPDLPRGRLRLRSLADFE